jgi:hypothetical protein
VANAKLSGSLLARKDARSATMLAQRVSAPNNVSVNRSLADRFESGKSALCASDSTDGQVVAAAERSGSASLTNERNRRFGPSIRFGLAVCVVAATTAVGIVVFMYASRHGGPTTAFQSNPAFPNVSNPATATGAPEPPITPESPPAAVAAPISPQPEPVIAGYAPAPAAQSAEARLRPEEVAALLMRGDALFGSGNVVSARLYYERAAEGGDAQAALRLGETYDSAFLARAHLNGVLGDAAAAARWYRYARGLGAVEAEILLNSVTAIDEAPKRSEDMNQLFKDFLARQRGQTR